MEDGNYFGDNQLLGLASILQQLHVWKRGPDWWGGSVLGRRGAGDRGTHIRGFDKNVKILYFVTKLLQDRQIVHKSVTDFPETCRDFHAQEREFGGPNAFGVLLSPKVGMELETMTDPVLTLPTHMAVLAAHLQGGFAGFSGEAAASGPSPPCGVVRVSITDPSL